NRTPFNATAVATGIGGATVTGTTTFTYYVGSGTSGLQLPSAPVGPVVVPGDPTNTLVSTFTVVATFTSSNANYGNAFSAPVTFTINRATPTVVASDAGGSFTGFLYPASAQVTGVGGTAVNDGFTAMTYYAGSSVSGSPLLLTPSAAGTYTVVATYTG